MANKIHRNRIQRLTESMQKGGLDLLICFKPEHTFYLSGFNPIINSHPVILLLKSDGRQTLLIHALRDDHARASSWVEHIQLYGKWATKKTMGMSWLAALQEIVGALGDTQGVIGMEQEFLSVSRHRTLAEAFPKARIEDCSPLIAGARKIKDPDELDHLKIAAKLADTGMTAAIETLSEGGSERQVAIASMAVMHRAWNKDYPHVEICDFGSLEGGVQNGLQCWCLAGDRVAYNCDNPTSRIAQPGELVTIFIWACANGMHAENERTVAVGKITPDKRNAFEAILEIREKTQKILAPGFSCADVYAEAARQYVRLGYERYLPGRIGHGMGLGCHEQPSLAAENEEMLKPGMVMSFEPNLRIPEWGGIQHSDTVLISETGCKFLTVSPSGLLGV